MIQILLDSNKDYSLVLQEIFFNKKIPFTPAIKNLLKIPGSKLKDPQSFSNKNY